MFLIRFDGGTECVDGDFLKVPNLLTVFLDFLECLFFGFFVDFTMRLFSDFRNAARVTEFGRTIAQNGGNGTEHGYGTALFMAGGLLKKSQVYSDWPGLKRKELYQGRDLNATIDARSVYASAMSTVFDLDFNRIEKEVFFGDKLQNLSDKLFKA